MGYRSVEGADIKFTGNIIGLDPSASINVTTLSASGIFATSTANNIQIGQNPLSPLPADRNIITNAGNIVSISGVSNAIVSGNFLGTDGLGKLDLTSASRCVYIQSSASGALISNNLISGCNIGINLTTVSDIITEYNFIGTDNSGMLAVPNAQGITVSHSASDVHINNNLVSGNTTTGILMTNVTNPGGVLPSRITSNIIGLTFDESADLGNSTDGISLSVTDGVEIGGALSTDGNIIGGNNSDGISSLNTTTNVLIQNNYVGINTAGSAMPNNENGLRLSGSGFQLLDNIISSNLQDGLFLSSFTDSVFYRNKIGTNPSGEVASPNGGDGIELGPVATLIKIGSGISSDGNIIAYNTNFGINVSNVSSVNNSILANAIHSNGGLGINLGFYSLAPYSITPNDLNDGDSGTNDVQNFPILTAATSSLGNTTITGSFNSTSSSSFLLEYFLNPQGTGAVDPSGNGEGLYFLGSEEVLTDGSGNYTVNKSFAFNLRNGDYVTATATELSGPAGSVLSTSEFAANIPVVSSAQPPTAVDNTAITPIDTSVDIIVLNNDTDPDLDLDSTSVTITSLPTNGSVSVNPATGVVTYLPNSGYTGTDMFEYEVCDETIEPLCDTAQVAVYIGEFDPDAVNDGPVDVAEDSVVATSIDWDNNDALLDNATLSTFDATSVNGGTVTDLGSGNFGYVPAAGFSGTDTFTYTICDDDTPTATCDTATVTINVVDEGSPDAVNDGPVDVAEDSVVATSIDWDNNDALLDNATLSTFDATSVNGGTVTDLGSGNFGYVPAAGFSGTDTFTYTICDDDTPTATCDTATVTINVVDEGSPDAVNDGPVDVAEDSVVATSIDWDNNDALLDNATLSTFDATSVNGGTVTDLGSGNFGYVPAAGFSGTDTFTYTICDDDTPTATCDTATVTINVVDEGSPDAVNDGPVDVAEDSVVATSIDWDNNDALLDNATLSTFDATSVNGGTVTDLGSGNFGYVPAAGFSGTDTFTYTICDDDTPTATCDTATVTINVVDEGSPDAVNDGPVDVAEDSVVATSIDWDNNDALLDNATLSTFDATSVNGGTVTDLGSGNFGYVPAAGFSGTDTFTYTICDDDTPTATCDTATVTINVVDEGSPDAVNDGPVDVAEDSVVATSIDWDNNDALLDNATLSTFDATSVNGGTVTDLGSGNFGYVPAAGFSGTDTFTYTICDDDTPTATCDTATVTINVVSSLDSDNDGIADDIDLDDDNDGILDTVEGNVDSDGDGIPNRLDLDSDNDGITDLIEAGGVDSNFDGIVDDFVDLDLDGYHDLLSLTPLHPIDSDGDGKLNFLDIDSDDDGITDTVEGQPSVSFRAPVGQDSDHDGLDDAYDIDTQGMPIVAVDTDGDNLPDYVDIDSDNDGIQDVVEGWDNNGDGIADYSPIGVDLDNDGLDDGYDSDTSHVNPFLNSIKSYSPLPNFDELGDRDWREVGGAACEDLRSTQFSVDGTARELKKVVGRALRFRVSLANRGICSGLGDTKAAQYKSQAQELYLSSWRRIWSLPSINFSSCATVLGSCTAVDYSSELSMILADVTQLKEIANRIIRNSCTRNRSASGVARLTRKVNRAYRSVTSSLEQYPEQMLLCGLD